MRKKLVLNACGLKSLGGIKLFVDAFDFFIKSGSEIIVLYSENEFYEKLKKQSMENQLISFIKITNKRFLHPFLNIIANSSQKKVIQECDAIIHFGNFGFRTKNKSFVLIQNILPFVKKDLKNKLLKLFILRSIKSSNFVLIQLNHIKQLIGQRYANKIIEIGEIFEKKINLHNNEGKVVFLGSNISNKNFDFMVKVLKLISLQNKITVINPPRIIKEFLCIYTENHSQTLKVMSENDIYFHASDYETVGLPLYEAQSLGLKIVAPTKPYMQYFSGENVFLYEPKNTQSALKSIEMATNKKIRTSQALIYIENWSKILKYI